MYKVLIADDEMIIRTELAKAFDWSAFGMEVIGLAKNGREALSIIQTEKPDICLLDINMPFLSGLELIEKINEENQNIVNVIISGYDEFQYAQKAVKLGVYEYILKPIDEDSFKTMLAAIKTKLDQSAKDKQLELLSNALLLENKDSLRNEFLVRWIHGEKSEQEIKEGLAFFKISPPDKMGMVLIKMNMPIGIIENETAKANMIHKCKKALTDFFDQSIFFCLVELNADSLLLLFEECGCIAWNNLERTLEQHLVERADIQGKAGKAMVANGISGVPGAFADIEHQLKTESAYMPLVKKIKQYVEKNYEDSQLRLQIFAEENQISISYLSKVFKQETGVAFIDYLIKFRIMKSLELLESTSLRICAIAEMVGYSSQHYYCEAFKKVMGVSPTEYRKRGCLQN